MRFRKIKGQALREVFTAAGGAFGLNFSSRAAALPPPISSGFSARHWAVSSPRKAFARRLGEAVDAGQALLTCFSMVSA
ncbi:hypothetical protein KCP71_02640 [Salmonella enterica subsp. enterica]|nr:hypothetical protein KCP71_02640 [Salmonella enterica subsp. enterica]